MNYVYVAVFIVTLLIALRYMRVASKQARVIQSLGDECLWKNEQIHTLEDRLVKANEAVGNLKAIVKGV